MDEARSTLAEARRLEPRLTIKWMVAMHAPILPPLFEGLRKAGLPDEEAAHLSIVVLPLTNLSGDMSQDYFADGITENLTTDLSRIHNSFVIARNTAFTFKGKNIDAREIAKELGVRYILEGSVQRDQNRVRINAQLIDADSGAHLWADHFEEDVADLFKLQEQVVARLANTLGWELVKAEAGKSAHSKSPDAIDLTMRAWALLFGPTPDSEAALALFDQALKIDPNEADALAGEAMIYKDQSPKNPRLTMTQRYSVRPTGPSHSRRTTCGHILQRAATWVRCTVGMRRSAPTMPDSRSIQIPGCFTGQEASSKNGSAAWT
jgi:TolB-like protein